MQESCRSSTYQTISARILQVSYILDKYVRFWQITHFLQIQTFLARFLQVQTLLARFFDGPCKTMSKNCKRIFNKLLRLMKVVSCNEKFCKKISGTNGKYQVCFLFKAKSFNHFYCENISFENSSIVAPNEH